MMVSPTSLDMQGSPIPDSCTGVPTACTNSSVVALLAGVAPLASAVVGGTVGGAGREPRMVSWTFLRKC